MSNCVLGPNDAGVFLSQICYELLGYVQFEKNFDIKLWKSRLDMPFQLDTHSYDLIKKSNKFLNEAPLADVLQWELKHCPNLSTIIELLNILGSSYILLKTTICLTTQILDKNFETNLYKELLELVDSLNPMLLEWKEKIQLLHIEYNKIGKPKGWKEIVKERNCNEFRKELKQDLDYVPYENDDEEIQSILENIYKKLNFNEKPLQFLSYYNKILCKNEMKKNDFGCYLFRREYAL